MKTIAAILFLITTLSTLTSSIHALRSLSDGLEEPGGAVLQADPPDDGNVIFQPPPRQ